jgi:hypothetical protein
MLARNSELGTIIHALQRGIWQSQFYQCLLSPTAKAGAFPAIGRARLSEHDEMEVISWTDRGKKEAHMLEEGRGVYPSLVATGTNRHDVNKHKLGQSLM